MTARSAIRGAWLLERAGVDRALTGDLVERVARGASLAWYWRQALAAVLTSWSRTVLSHKRLAARAILTGWVLWAVLWLPVRYFSEIVDPSAMFWVKLIVWVAIGWTIGRLHRPYQCSMVSAYAAFSLVMSVPAVSRALVQGVGHPAYAPPSVLMLVLVLISLLTGGLLSAAR